MPLLEEVTFFMVWFDPDLPVLRIHLNNTGPTARLTARRYHARISPLTLCSLLTGMKILPEFFIMKTGFLETNTFHPVQEN